MPSRKKTKATRRKRLPSGPASSPQTSASGAAGTGKNQSLPFPGGTTRFIDRFSRRDALAVLALGLLAGVCYLPAMLWGGFESGMTHLVSVPGGPGVVRSQLHLVLAVAH